jgi:hypothetical protein
MRVKCTGDPQTCASVSARSTNSKSVSSQSLNVVRVSLQVQMGVDPWPTTTWHAHVALVPIKQQLRATDGGAGRRGRALPRLPMTRRRSPVPSAIGLLLRSH